MKAMQRFLNAVLYLSTEDERVKAAVDRAGYQSLLALVALLAVDVLGRNIMFHQSSLPQSDVVVLLVITALILVVQTYRYGCTFLDTAVQRKVTRTFLGYSSLLMVVVGYLLVVSNTGPLVQALQSQPILLWTFPVVAGVAIWGILWGVLVVYERATVARLKAKLESEGDRS